MYVLYHREAVARERTRAERAEERAHLLDDALTALQLELALAVEREHAYAFRLRRPPPLTTSKSRSLTASQLQYSSGVEAFAEEPFHICDLKSQNLTLHVIYID